METQTITQFSGGVVPLGTFSGKWPQYLDEFGVSKVGMYSGSSAPYREYQFLHRMVLEVPTLERMDPALVTYFGFRRDPTGVMFRSLADKMFKDYHFESPKNAMYVAEMFENNIGGAMGFEYGMPIVLMEGVLDVEAFVFMTAYPFAIGYLTSFVNYSLVAIIASLTDKVLLIPDNDEAGKSGGDKTVKYFEDFGIKVKVCETNQQDFADVWAYRDEQDVLKAKTLLKSF